MLLTMIPCSRTTSVPSVERALRDPNGLLAAGATFTRALVDAYTHGIFPWFGEDDPLLWWSPDPRMVLFVGELHVSRTLRRAIKSGRLTVTFDRAFREVMAGCAEPRADAYGTWITDDMVEAYGELADRGIAHSMETWHDDRLVGGL